MQLNKALVLYAARDAAEFSSLAFLVCLAKKYIFRMFLLYKPIFYSASIHQSTPIGIFTPSILKISVNNVQINKRPWILVKHKQYFKQRALFKVKFSL